MSSDRIAVCLGVSETGRLSRRCLVARVAALPAILGFTGVADPGSTRAKNGPGKGKQHHGKKQSAKKGNRRGGGYAPDAEELAFLDLINDYRRQHGVSPLALQHQLGAAAAHHSRAMARQNFYRHSPLENVADFGYKHWHVIGENICAGHASASRAMDAWKNSPGHNKNMLNPNFTAIGIGRAYHRKSKYDWYWTTTFGDR
jgi:uncharacterized protein YkwD